jgi:hypothetical protein
VTGSPFLATDSAEIVVTTPGKGYPKKFSGRKAGMWEQRRSINPENRNYLSYHIVYDLKTTK